MESLAVKNGSMISAAMLGALAASEALPFARTAYEAIVGAGAKGASASLKAFAAAFDRTRTAPREAPPQGTVKRLDALPQDAGHPELNRLLARIRGEFPEAAQPMLFAGIKRTLDFQDVAYAHEYLDRVGAVAALDRAHGGADKGFALTCEAAKYIAVAMAYDDVIRVADIKVRSSRFARLRNEIGARPDQIVHSTEYLHPRAEEVCGALPAWLGGFIESRPELYGALDKFVNRGRRIDVRRLGGFLQLYLVSGLRALRRGNLRHGREIAHREAWLARAADVLPKNYDLAVEVVRCRRLVKGYSDTHSRGLSKFDRVMAMVPKLVGRADGAVWLERLKRAALLDEAGTALDGAIKTVQSL
jgi:indolepyruvate ferredoxin oxidoreductase beta subunit